MFKSKDKRFITRGVNTQCSEELRVLCWGLIDELVENEEVEVDYLQIFELKRHSSNHSYILSHHQEEPPYQKEYELNLHNDETGQTVTKLWVIDDGTTQTMLLPEEY